MIILVTGSSKGIGRQLVEYYCSDASNFVFGISRSKTDFTRDNYDHFIGDVTEEDSVKLLIKHIKITKGYIDLLINNAGIANMNALMLTSVESVENTFKTNFIGTFP